MIFNDKQTCELIQQSVCQFFQIDTAEILWSKRRVPARIYEARHFAICLACEYYYTWMVALRFRLSPKHVQKIAREMKERFRNHRFRKHYESFRGQAIQLMMPSCYIHPSVPAIDSIRVPCAVGGKIYLCAECKADPQVIQKTFEKYRQEHSKRKA